MHPRHAYAAGYTAVRLATNHPHDQIRWRDHSWWVTMEQPRPDPVAIENATHALPRVALLGEFSVAVGARTIEAPSWRLRKASHILKLLALVPRHQLHREQVIETLWPHLDVDAAANNLRVTLHFARRLLEDAEGFGSNVLVWHGDQLILFPDRIVLVDVEQFENAADIALHSRDPLDYEQALGHYRGELLPDDRFEEWVIGRRESLRALYLLLLHTLGRLRAERGEFHAAIDVLRRVVRDDPASESAHVALMRLQMQTGQRKEALRQYQQLRDALQRELDIEPEPDTIRFYEAILAGAVKTNMPPAEATVPSPVSARSRPGLLQALPNVPRTNLPQHLTSFIGRERELAAVQAALAAHRLVTLLGPGGCGKTRLALELADRLLETYRDGVWFVDLAGFGDPLLVPQAVASTLGIRETIDQALLEAIEGFLRGRQLLLLLDNCEHLVAGCATLADRLLRACPSLTLLATSREALRVDGELRWLLAGLAFPDNLSRQPISDLSRVDAVTLFCERAQLARPSFQLTAENAASVVAICQGLEGMPLAIELAATKISALPAEQIADRLDRSLRLLVGSDLSSPPRQQSLRAAIDWSYELLSAPERLLLARLAVFAGSFSLDAIETVCSAGGIESDAILDLLFQLADKSLVVVDERGGSVRYRLLEPIRQYAAERLDGTGEATSIRARHAQHYLELAERVEPRLIGPDQGRWLDRLQDEHDNLRAALTWSLAVSDVDRGLRLTNAIWRFWHLRGYLGEGRRWSQDVLELDGARAPSSVLAGALFGIGRLALLQGDLAAARCSFEDCLAVAIEVGDTDYQAGALTQLAHCAFRLGDFSAARASYEASLPLRRQMGNPWYIAITLCGLAGVAVAESSYAEAREQFEEGLRILRVYGEDAEYARAMNRFAMLAEFERDFSGANGWYLANRARSLDVGDQHGVAVALIGLGYVALAAGEASEARKYFHESLSIIQQLGNRRLVVDCLEGLIQVAVLEDRAADAIQMAEAATTMRLASEEPALPQRQLQLEQALARASETLGADERIAARDSGRLLSIEQLLSRSLAGSPDVG